MPRLIDATKWEEFYKEMTDGLKPYDHYDDGYRDAMDNVDDWMDGNQVEADPVRHGRWDDTGRYTFTDGSLAIRCTECGAALHLDEWEKYNWNYCPNCGCKMDGESDE